MKDDSQQPVTNAVFRKAMGTVDQRFKQVDQRFEQVDKRFDQMDQRIDQMDQRMIKNDKGYKTQFQLIMDRFDDIEERMYTKEDHKKHMEILDEFITEMRDSREERILSSSQFARTNDQVIDHEKRISVLESASN